MNQIWHDIVAQTSEVLLKKIRIIHAGAYLQMTWLNWLYDKILDSNLSNWTQTIWPYISFIVVQNLEMEIKGGDIDIDMDKLF